MTKMLITILLAAAAASCASDPNSHLWSCDQHGDCKQIIKFEWRDEPNESDGLICHDLPWHG